LGACGGSGAAEAFEDIATSIVEGAEHAPDLGVLQPF